MNIEKLRSAITEATTMVSAPTCQVGVAWFVATVGALSLHKAGHAALYVPLLFGFIGVSATYYTHRYFSKKAIMAAVHDTAKHAAATALASVSFPIQKFGPMNAASLDKLVGLMVANDALDKDVYDSLLAVHWIDANRGAIGKAEPGAGH